MAMHLNVGIIPRSGKDWIAGVIYIQNLVRAINLLSEEEKPTLYFVSSSGDDIRLYRDLGKWLPPLKRYAFRRNQSIASKITGVISQVIRFQRAVSLERLTQSLKLSAFGDDSGRIVLSVRAKFPQPSEVRLHSTHSWISARGAKPSKKC